MPVIGGQVTPSDVLGRLAQDEEAMVRVTVARNPGSTPTILDSLAQDEHEEVRFVAVDPYSWDDLDEL